MRATRILLFGFWIVFIAGFVRAQEALTVSVVNTTGQNAADLHITFAGSGGSVNVDPATVMIRPLPDPPCDPPAVPSNGQVTSTVVLEFDRECVGAPATVEFTVTTDAGPLEQVGGFWTDDTGANIGPVAPVAGPPANQVRRADTSWCFSINPPPIYLPAPGAAGVVDAGLTGALGRQFPPGGSFAAGGALPGGPAKFNITAYNARMVRHTVGGAGFELEYSDGMAGAKAQGLRWVQLITTNKPLGGAVSPYLDPFNRNTDPSLPPYPFYLDELPAGDPGGFSDADFSNTDAAAAAGAVDYRFEDFPNRSCWMTDDTGRMISMHTRWRAELRGVTWDLNRADGAAVGDAEAGANCTNSADDDGDGTINDGCTSTITVHDGIQWGFDLWPKLHLLKRIPVLPLSSSPESAPVTVSFDSLAQTAQIAPTTLAEITYRDGTPGLDDPLQGAQVSVSGLQVQLLDEVRDDGRGPLGGMTGSGDVIPLPPSDVWSFQDARLQLTLGETLLMSADMNDVFLFQGSQDGTAGSEFQARLGNIEINNQIESRYLAEIQQFLAESADFAYCWSFPTDLLSATDGLAVASESLGQVRLFGFEEITPLEELCLNGQLDEGEACDPSAVPDGCPAGQICAQDCSGCLAPTGAWAFRGTAQGGQITLSAQADGEACTVTLLTLPGQSAQDVATHLMGAINSSACWSSLGISAAAQGGNIFLFGIDQPGIEILTEVNDAGLQHNLPGRLHFAQFGNGEGFFSDTVLSNPSSAETVLGSLDFLDDDGQPLQVGIGGQPFSRVDFVIPPLGSFCLKTDGLGSLAVGSALVSASNDLGGVVRFSIPGTGIAGVGASQPVSGFLTPARRQLGGINTGIAIQNTEDHPVELHLQLVTKDGEEVAGATLLIEDFPAQGHLAAFINELFQEADLDDFTGSLIVRVEGGEVAATALELGSQAGQFTTLPVTPLR